MLKRKLKKKMIMMMMIDDVDGQKSRRLPPPFIHFMLHHIDWSSDRWETELLMTTKVIDRTCS